MKKIFISMLAILMMIVNVNAESIFAVDGENLTDTGVYDQTRIRFGQEVTSDAEIDGINFTFGQNITTNGKSSYMFNFANHITLNETVDKDAFIFANYINIGSDAILKRDVYLFANDVKVNANIKRNARIFAESVDLSGIVINGNATIDASKIDLTNTIIKGQLKYPEEAEVTGLTSETAGSTSKTFKTETKDEEDSGYSISGFITKVLGMFLMVVITFALIPKIKNGLDKIELERSVASAWKGLILCVCAPLPLFILMCTMVLTRLSILSFMLYIILLFIAVPFGTYVLGKNVFKKLNIKIDDYAGLIISLVVINILFYFPVVGGLLRFFVVCYFLGILIDALSKVRNVKTKK